MTPSDFLDHERRRHERIGVPSIVVSFEGRHYDTESWSLGGFLVEGYEGRLSAGSLFTVDGIGTPDGDLSSVEIRSRVVRADLNQNRLVVSFLDIDDRAYTVLREVMAERMRVLRDSHP